MLSPLLLAQGRQPALSLVLILRDCAQSAAEAPGRPLVSHLSTSAEIKRAAQQQEDQEQKEDEEDEQTLHRAREWDDWKDTHPRGYGNRKNMG